jgi:hypothetical protein
LKRGFIELPERISNLAFERPLPAVIAGWIQRKFDISWHRVLPTTGFETIASETLVHAVAIAAARRHSGYYRRYKRRNCPDFVTVDSVVPNVPDLRLLVVGTAGLKWYAAARHAV